MTNCGSFTIRLDPRAAPGATVTLVQRARDGFYDETTFHNVARGLLIEGGDPTGTGAGSLSYLTHDSAPPAKKYARGVVAMSNPEGVPAEGPDLGYGGSQFFVVTAARLPFPLRDVIVGRVVEGFDAIARIDALGNEEGLPSQPVVIETIKVETS